MTQPSRRSASVRDFGAEGEGQVPETIAVQQAVDSVPSRGVSLFHVPPARHVIGIISIKDGVHLDLDFDAVLPGSSNGEDDPPVGDIRNRPDQ